MADNNNTVSEVTSSNPIEQINHNFKVITQRIKNLNLNISYMDLLCVQEVYTVTSGAEEPKTFVANCWNTLPNYSSVVISGGSFTFLGNNVASGGFLVKLPDNQCLYVQGVSNTGAFVPTATIPGSITYSYSTSASSTAPVTIDYATATGSASITTGALPSGIIPQDARWFAGNEEVFWDGSHTATESYSSIVDSHIFIYN